MQDLNLNNSCSSVSKKHNVTSVNGDVFTPLTPCSDKRLSLKTLDMLLTRVSRCYLGRLRLIMLYHEYKEAGQIGHL